MVKTGWKHSKMFWMQLLVAILAVTGLNADITGTVFRDLPVNGTTLGVYGEKHADEQGVAGVTVSAYAADGTQAAMATTAADGTYTLTTGAGDYRVEFSAWPSYLKESPDASGSATSVQFVADGATTVNLGLHNPADYTDTTNPKLFSSIFVNGASDTGNPVSDQGGIYSWNYNASGGGGDASEAQLANEQDVGNVWGIAYDKKRKKVYAATVVKRHAGVLNHELGRIYETNVDGTGTATFIDIPNAGNLADDAARGLGSPGDQNRDPDALSATMKQGLGDIDITDDQSTLYAMNLNDKKLYKIDIATKSITGSYDTPNPCGVTGKNRPFAVEATEGKVFVGVVCDASISGLDSDLTADVYEFDGTNFTSIYHHTLDYARQQSQNGTVGWHAWSDNYQTIAEQYHSDDYWQVVRSQPVLADIKFADNGNLIIGLLDRVAFQGGFHNLPVEGVPNDDHQEYKTISGGDMLIATPDGTGQYIADPDDEDADANTESVSADNSPVNAHKESALGGITILRGSGEVAMLAYDPANGGGNRRYHTVGVVFFDESNGNRTDAYRVLDNTDPKVAHFGKGAGMGDIEILTTLAPVEIGNRVWLDADGDGVQDAGESGIAGVTVELYDAAGITLLATATTDANGNYIFSNDPAGTTTASHIYNIAGLDPDIDYIVRIPNVSGGSKQGALGSNLLTTSNQGTDIHDSDGIASGTNANATVLATDIPLAGANNHSFDFGFTPPKVSLGSVIWNDADNSGTQDASESGIAGAVVTLLDGAGNPVAGVPTQTTDANGTYFFDNLPEGDYSVQVDMTGTTGFIPSSIQVANADANADNDSNIVSGTPATGIYTSGVVTLSNDAEPTGETSALPNNGNDADAADDNNGNMTVDFGFYQPASLGDKVWYDDNRDGVQDPTEDGVVGVKVYLLDENGDRVQDNNGDDIFTETNSTGEYLFTDLAPGVYAVEFDITTLPTIYVPTSQDEGNDEAVDSDADVTTGKTAFVTLNSGDEYRDLDMGIVKGVGSLSGNVSHEDGDGNLHPIKDVTIVLYDENGNEVARTTTDENGNYEFRDLTPGNYTVAELQPEGYFDVRENAGGADDDNSTQTPVNTISATVDGGENDVQNDFVEALPASLGDRVWYDNNADGIQDTEEDGVSGVTVYLLDENGDQVAQTETNEIGGYIFENLDPNREYVVQFDTDTLPDEYVPTLEGEGTEATGSDADPETGRTALVSLTPGEHNPHIDMGIHREGATPQRPYRIGTHFWIDHDNDGKYDGGDQGVDEPIGGALVELLDENGDPVLDENGEPRVTYTSTEPGHVGEYHFDVPAGTYGVRFHIPDDPKYDGYVFDTPQINNNDGANINTANNDGYTQIVTVGPGSKTQDLTLDAGINCGCENAPIKSNGGDALGVFGILSMMFMTLMTALLFVRKEEEQSN